MKSLFDLLTLYITFLAFIFCCFAESENIEPFKNHEELLKNFSSFDQNYV